MQRSTVLTLLALTALIAFLPGVAAAPYDLGTANDVNVPEQTVTIDGAQYTIDAVGRVQRGDQLTVSVSVDGDEEYNLDLYNADEQVVAFRDGTGDGTATFETSSSASRSSL